MDAESGSRLWPVAGGHTVLPPLPVSPALISSLARAGPRRGPCRRAEDETGTPARHGLRTRFPRVCSEYQSPPACMFYYLIFRNRMFTSCIRRALHVSTSSALPALPSPPASPAALISGHALTPAHPRLVLPRRSCLFYKLVPSLHLLFPPLPPPSPGRSRPTFVLAAPVQSTRLLAPCASRVAIGRSAVPPGAVPLLVPDPWAVLPARGRPRAS